MRSLLRVLAVVLFLGLGWSLALHPLAGPPGPAAEPVPPSQPPAAQTADASLGTWPAHLAPTPASPEEPVQAPGSLVPPGQETIVEEGGRCYLTPLPPRGPEVEGVHSNPYLDRDRNRVLDDLDLDLRDRDSQDLVSAYFWGWPLDEERASEFQERFGAFTAWERDADVGFRADLTKAQLLAIAAAGADWHVHWIAKDAADARKRLLVVEEDLCPAKRGPDVPGVHSSPYSDRDRNRIFDGLDALLAPLRGNESIEVIVLFTRPADDDFHTALQRDLGPFDVERRWDRSFGGNGGMGATMTKDQVLALAQREDVHQVEHNGIISIG